MQDDYKHNKKLSGTKIAESNEIAIAIFMSNIDEDESSNEASQEDLRSVFLIISVVMYPSTVYQLLYVYMNYGLHYH